MKTNRIRLCVRAYLDNLAPDVEVTCAQIAAAINREPNTVSDCLTKLRVAGEVAKTNRGNQSTYKLTGKPSGARRVGRDEDHYRERQARIMAERRAAARAKRPDRPALAPAKPKVAAAPDVPLKSSQEFEREGGVVEVLPGFYRERPRFADVHVR